MMDGNFISRKRIGGIVALSFLQFGNLSGQERPNKVRQVGEKAAVEVHIGMSRMLW